jgi:hypothetical protein
MAACAPLGSVPLVDSVVLSQPHHHQLLSASICRAEPIRLQIRGVFNQGPQDWYWVEALCTTHADLSQDQNRTGQDRRGSVPHLL